MRMGFFPLFLHYICVWENIRCSYYSSKSKHLLRECCPHFTMHSHVHFMFTVLERHSCLLWCDGNTSSVQWYTNRWISAVADVSWGAWRRWSQILEHSALQWSNLFDLFFPLPLLFPVGITCGEILSFWQIKAPCLPVFLGYLDKVGGIKHLQ